MKNAIYVMSLCLTFSVSAATFTLKVLDSKQQPLPYTVVELINDNYPAIPQSDDSKVVQQDLNFQPFVSVVSQGTLVEFPNLDKTRHHVYSFSKAKTFELRLFAGKSEAPVLFDQAGIVTLGCNIHDHMLAYIYIHAGRFAAVTNAAGEASFSDLPQTSYQLKLWHPWQKQELEASELTIEAGENNKVVTLDIVQQALPKAPKKGFGDY